MKQWIVCPLGSRSPVLQGKKPRRYSKNSCICYSSSDKTASFEMLWGYVLPNIDGKSKWTNQILLVSDLADVCLSWIILKYLLMRTTLPFISLQPIPHCCEFWVLTLLYIAYIFQIALWAPGHRALMDQILHNKYNPLLLCFQVENQVYSPAAMLRQNLLRWS